MNIRPVHDFIVVKQDKAPTMHGSIALPDTGPKPTRGKVLAVGPGRVEFQAGLERAELVPMSVKVGDTAIYGEYAGRKIVIDSEEYMLIRDSEVMGVVEDPALIAPKTRRATVNA